MKDDDLLSGSYSSVPSGWVAMPELYSNLKLNSVPFFVRIYADWKRILAHLISNINHIITNTIKRQSYQGVGRIKSHVVHVQMYKCLQTRRQRMAYTSKLTKKSY